MKTELKIRSLGKKLQKKFRVSWMIMKSAEKNKFCNKMNATIFAFPENTKVVKR